MQSIPSQRRSSVTVPFVDLRPVHDAVREPILLDLAQLVDTGAFVNGPEVAQFERAFAVYCRRRECVGMASGLDALRLGLQAAGIERGPGD